MSNHVFKGQVKVSDVQAAFDDYVNKINTIISTYNTTETILENIDLTVGSPTLAASGYTLSIGGIKQVLEAYNGTLFGCRAFKYNSNKVLITDGIYLTTDKPIRIHSQILSGSGNYIMLDTTNETIAVGNTIVEGYTPIMYLSAVSGDEYLSTYKDMFLEGLDGYYITINKTQMPQEIMSDNTSIDRFNGAGVYWSDSGGADTLTFNNQEVLARGYAYNGGAAYRGHATALPANFLFIPKGVSSPLKFSGTKHMNRTLYKMKLNKKS